MSEFNIERLREAVAWVEAEAAKPKTERRWHQGSWLGSKFGERARWRKSRTVYGDSDGDVSDWRQIPVSCGTTYCVAGHLCALEKDTFLVDEGTYTYAKEQGWSSVSADYVLPKGETEPVDIGDRAAELLGINGGEAARLFAGSNSAAAVRRIARDIAKEYGETL